MMSSSLNFSKMAGSFENLEDILPNWVNEDVKKKVLPRLWTNSKSKKNNNETRFFIENDFQLEQSQSSAR